ncbi:MAG: hypothetical protein ACRYHA_22560 [Janthinobacterium lividum]
MAILERRKKKAAGSMTRRSRTIPGRFEHGEDILRQSKGIGEADLAISHLEQVTQQHAALVAESAAAVGSLRDLPPIAVGGGAIGRRRAD